MRASNSGDRRSPPLLEKRIQGQLRAGKGMLATAKALGGGTGTVQRVAREMGRSPFRRRKRGRMKPQH